MKKTSMPVQYLRGYCEFYKLKFNLTPDVLIPRPETELLVDQVLRVYRDRHSGSRRIAMTSSRDHKVAKQSLTVLDLGTGSGCIAISIAKNNPNIKVIATDISKDALKVAEKNAKLHKVENQIIFLQSDLLDLWSNSLVYHTKPRVDVIVTNLPYIPTARLKYIDPMVTEFEPRVALDGGEDGFELYRKLFQQISLLVEGVKLNHPEGGKLKYLFGEIDYTHGELAVQEALKYFPNAEVEVKKDLAHMQRILSIRF